MCYVYCACHERTSECVMSAVHDMRGQVSVLCLLCVSWEDKRVCYVYCACHGRTRECVMSIVHAYY